MPNQFARRGSAQVRPQTSQESLKPDLFCGQSGTHNLHARLVSLLQSRALLDSSTSRIGKRWVGEMTTGPGSSMRAKSDLHCLLTGRLITGNGTFFVFPVPSQVLQGKGVSLPKLMSRSSERGWPPPSAFLVSSTSHPAACYC